MHMLRSIANTEVVHIQKAFHTRANRLHNILNFYTKECNGKNASLGNAHFLFVMVGKSVSNPDYKLTFIQKCRNEITNATSNSLLHSCKYDDFCSLFNVAKKMRCDTVLYPPVVFNFLDLFTEKSAENA